MASPRDRLNRLCRSCIRLGLMLSIAGSAQAASFTPLGDLPGGDHSSEAKAISADNTTIVGTSSVTSGGDAFRWTLATGMLPLGVGASGIAHGVSGDGSVITGVNSGGGFRWDALGGVQVLGDLPGGLNRSNAYDVSADGSTIVGYGHSASGPEAFRWNASVGMVGLGDLPGGTFSSEALAVNADGTTIVGSSQSSIGREAFIWSPSTGMQSLGEIPDGFTQTSARGLTSDGSHVLGHALDSANHTSSWVWDTAQGLRFLPTAAGSGQGLWANSISDDGSIIVGTYAGNGFNQAFVWDETNGTQSLHALLFGLGADVTGWLLTSTDGVSADGRSIVGQGINPAGATEAFLAYIPESIEDRDVDDPNTTTYRKTDGATVDPLRHVNGTPYAFTGPNLTPGVIWPNADLSSADLFTADLRSAVLSNTDFSGSILDGADLRSANLMNSTLEEMDLRSANLDGTNFEGANLRGSNLSGLDLRQTLLGAADLTGASLVGARLADANLSQAVLINVDLQHADLYHANLFAADLTGADLRDAELFGANLGQAILTDAVLTGAHFGQTTFPVGFDPAAAGMLTGPRVINNGLAPPNPDNVLIRPDMDLVINNAGCNALLRYPCLTPGSPTTVVGHGYDVRVYETSVFIGDASNLAALDSSQVTANVFDGVQVSGSANVIATGFDEASASIFGSSFAELRGSFDPVSISGNSHVLFNASTGEANSLSVAENGHLDFRGYSTVLSAAGGTTVINQGETQLLYVGPESRVTLERGIIGDHAYNMWGLVNVLGDFEMRDGTIRDAPIFVSGRALFSDGRITADSEDPEYISAIGPWSLIARLSGSIDIHGGLIDPFIKLAARDSSTIRIFGSTFFVDGSAVPYGSLVAPLGVLSGTLSSGDPVNNAFAQKGVDCGGIPCNGRILVLLAGDDWDVDGIPNVSDNCPDESNPGQEDIDSDGVADACNSSIDRDGDDWANTLDNCQYDANPTQMDVDGDGIGDVCDSQLIFWSDRGPSGCFDPPSGELFAPVTTDLANWEAVSRDEQPCDCFGIELPLPPGASSIRFRHVAPNSMLSEYCENSPPYALGLAVGQRICSNELDQDGLHTLTATPYSAAGCQYGGGTPLPTSERRFWITAPEPAISSTLVLGVAGLAIAARRRRNLARNSSALCCSD